MRIFALFGVIVLVLAILMMGYCGYSLYAMGTQDVPKVAAATARFVELYDREDFTGVYGLCDAAYVAKIPREEHDRSMRKVREYAGNLVLGVQRGWNGQVFNGDKYLTIAYACTSDKGDMVLTMKFHEEGAWKLQSFNVNRQ